MAIAFRDCRAPSGYVIGVIGDSEAWLGSVSEAEEPLQRLGAHDPVVFAGARSLILDHTLALKGARERSDAALQLEQFRRTGGTAVLASHEPELLLWLADEIWWVEDGEVKAKGDPQQTLDAFRHDVARKLREKAAGRQLVLPPRMRKGDGRATLESIETLDADGNPTTVWQSGAHTQVRVTVQFQADVEDPVIGILIRTRIGFEVFGTNTELEKLKVGPCRAGQRVAITFRFVCHLCPNEYTLTAASHDPDGIWHDWVEDGVAFAVSDHRYTAGVACLRAEVSAVHLR